jgi:uncharacterized protein DUF1329
MKTTKWLFIFFVAASIGLVGMFNAPQALAADEITSDNWTEMTSFKPELDKLKGLKGKKIKKSNVSEVADYIPPSLKMWIEKYGLVLKIKEYEPIYPSEGYIEATNKYLGQAKLVDIGKDYRKRGIKNYTAGLPFPKPKTGLEIAWNYNYSYNGDDGDTFYTVYWISGATGVEHTEEWRWAFIIRTINRTDLDPKPAIKQFLDKGLQYTSITYAIAPYDKKGFGALYSRSVNPLDQQGHIYVPAMRRVLRNTFGTRGDTWNSTDLLYEDVRGYMGYPEWMNWKLIEKKTVLLPMHAGVKLGKKNAKKTYELTKKPYWNPKMKYEPRAVYVVEVTPKFPDYPYSKQIMYFDAETFYIPYKEAYDKKGDLWKVVMLGINESPDMDSQPPEYGACVVVDFQAEHATLFNFHSVKANTGLDPKMFTLSNLRKRGR